MEKTNYANHIQAFGTD